VPQGISGGICRFLAYQLLNENCPGLILAGEGEAGIFFCMSDVVMVSLKFAGIFEKRHHPFEQRHHLAGFGVTRGTRLADFL